MKPPPFAYFTPHTTEEAVALLAGCGDEAKVLAGSQSLVPLMNFRLARPKVLVDINHVCELDYIRQEGDGIAVGALARQAAVERAPLVSHLNLLLGAAIRLIGHPAIRHRGTVGGSIAHADPAAELPLLASLLDVRVTARSVGGERCIDASHFFLGYFATALAPDDLLTEVWFPSLQPEVGWSISELTRRHGDFALVAAAATVVLRSDGRMESVRLALSGVGEAPVRVPELEMALAGQSPEPQVLNDAAALVGEQINPEGDLHASAEYRKAMARVYARQVLGEAVARAEERMGNAGAASSERRPIELPSSQ